MTLPKLFLPLVIAITLGLGIFLSSGAFFLMAVFSGFIIFVKLRHGKKVFYIFLCSIILRITFSFFNVFAGYTAGIGSDLIGDSVGYSGGGAYVAEVLNGKEFSESFIGDELANLVRFRRIYDGSLPDYNAWRVGGFTYYLGLIYASFGFSPVTVKLINSLLLVIAIYIIYRYLLKNFGEQVGFLFLVISLFSPSLFFWSISGLKDTITFFLFVVGIFSLRYLIKEGEIWGIILSLGILLKIPFIVIINCIFLPFKKSGGALIGVIICALLMFLSMNSVDIIRPAFSPVFYNLLKILSLLYLFLFFYRYKKFKIGIVSILIVVLAIFHIQTKEMSFKAYKILTFKSITKNIAYRDNALTQYRIYPVRYDSDEEMKLKGFEKFIEPSISEFIVMFLKGIGYALFSPLVWLSRSKLALLSSPEGHFMVISFLGVLSALFFCIRKISYFSLALPILIPFIFVLTLLSFFEGNVGTLFRHRSIMLPFYFALLAIGMGKKSIKATL